MSKPLNYHHDAPALFPLYARAIIPKGLPGSKKGDKAHIPKNLRTTLTGITPDPDRLEQYREICGFPPGAYLPLTWPHIEAFPLHIRLMTDPSFPFPLLGLVHMHNQITQYRPIRNGECLDIECTLNNQNNTKRGVEFDVVTRLSSSGRTVWEESSTILYRQPSSHNGSAQSSKAAPTKYSHECNLTAAGNIGRRYGRVSGDLNPIHLHPLSARAFGFPRAIAHGMWTKALCLGVLSTQADFTREAIQVEASFKRPILLPSTVSLSWEKKAKEWPFKVINAQGTAPHLEGAIRWLD